MAPGVGVTMGRSVTRGVGAGVAAVTGVPAGSLAVGRVLGGTVATSAGSSVDVAGPDDTGAGVGATVATEPIEAAGDGRITTWLGRSGPMD